MKSRNTEPTLKVFYVRLSASKKKDQTKEEAEKDAAAEYHSQFQALSIFGTPDDICYEKKSGVKPLKALKDLIHRLPSGSTIYAVRIDRLTRQGPFALGSLIGLAIDRGITIQTIDDGVLTGKVFDELAEIRTIFDALVARREHSVIVKRILDYQKSCDEKGILWGVKKAIANGNHRHAGPKKEPKFIEALPRLKELHDLGISFREIARIATKEFGVKFSQAHVHRMITGTKYPYKPKPKSRTA